MAAHRVHVSLFLSALLAFVLLACGGTGSSNNTSGGGNGADGGTSGGVTPGGACIPESRACSGQTPLVCSTQGVWHRGAPCPFACASGFCAGECVDGNTDCSGNVPLQCVGGRWQRGNACAALCSKGKCEDSCSRGAQDCSQSTARSCVTGSSWDTAAICPFACQNGACTGACTPGQLACSDDGRTPLACGADGQFRSGDPCPGACSAGVCSASTELRIVRLSLSEATLTLSPNEVRMLSLAAVWSDDSRTDVTGLAEWSSSDPSIAHVSGGRVTGVKAGRATITARVANAGEATVTLDVSEATPTELVVPSGTVSISSGGTTTISITARFSDGTTRDVTKEATLSSDNRGVVEVSADGKLTAKGPGRATIRVTYGLLSIVITVVVSEATVERVTLRAAASTVTVGESVSFYAEGHFSDGSTRDVTREVTWSVNNGSLAHIDNLGQLRALAAGELIVTAALGGQFASASITVLAPRIVSIAISPSAGAVTKADTLQFSATATYQNGLTANVTSSVTWTVDDPSVGVIAPDGTFTAIKVGATQVRASYAGVSTYTAVTVDAPRVTGITISLSSLSIVAGTEYQLVLTAQLSNGTTRNVTNEAQWTTGASGVAVVSFGKVTGVGAGTTQITATLEGRATTITVSVTSAGFTLSGTVTGATGPLTLADGLGNTVLVGADGVFSFPTLLNAGATYNVTVAAKPAGTTCSVVNGAGVISGPITNITVACRSFLYLFVTDAKFNGMFDINGGAAAMAAADSACNADINKPAGSGTFKAMLAGSTRTACLSADCGSGGTAEHVDWVLAPNFEYRRQDGVTAIGTTTANGTFWMVFLTPISMFYNNMEAPVWTGLKADWTSHADNCSDWTSPSALDDGRMGECVMPSVNQSISTMVRTCDSLTRLYCAEQP